MLINLFFYQNNVNNTSLHFTPQMTNNATNVSQVSRKLCPRGNSKSMNSSLWPVHFRPESTGHFPGEANRRKGENERKTERQIEMFCVITWVCRTTARITVVPWDWTTQTLSTCQSNFNGLSNISGPFPLSISHAACEHVCALLINWWMANGHILKAWD